MNKKQIVLWCPWPLLCTHLISCLLPCCDQSDYWNNTTLASHKMDVQGGEKLLLTYLMASEGWPENCVQFIVLFLWDCGSLGTLEAPSPSHLLPEFLAIPMDGAGLAALYPSWNWVAGAGQGGEWVGGRTWANAHPHYSVCVHCWSQTSVKVRRF